MQTHCRIRPARAVDPSGTSVRLAPTRAYPTRPSATCPTGPEVNRSALRAAHDPLLLSVLANMSRLLWRLRSAGGLGPSLAAQADVQLTQLLLAHR